MEKVKHALGKEETRGGGEGAQLVMFTAAVIKTHRDTIKTRARL